ncbi:MAG: hypothetical protein IJ079_03795 [Lachnospiraceae bacterium]|nr:hypothetical protein [Lachnospiraceae bacterium]MBR1567531.1 hypothetical protein [Lachnospiraceae bacterium]MBR1568687.1 hypothetical protein [Lachnospiraceae bacterium]
MVSKEMLSGMDSGVLVDTVLSLSREVEDAKADLDLAQAELQSRAEKITADRNIKFTEFTGSKGICSVTTAQSLDILNLPKLKELLGSELVDQKVILIPEPKQKVDAKFKEALIAIFMGEYTAEYTLEQVVHEIAQTYDLDAAAERTILKKLKGDYKKDKKVLMDVIGLTEDNFNLDEELYYIYQIKKYNLIKAYLSEEELTKLAEEIRKCMVVEETVKVTVKNLD